MFKFCESCKFYCYWYDYSGNDGVCRRYPPVIYQSADKAARYPVVKKKGWCGEYKRSKK